MLMHDPTIAETKAIAELAEANDRSMALIAGVIVEQRLSRLLEKILRNDGAAFKQSVRTYGFLHPFDAKILLGYMLGLYGQQTRNDLDRIRAVRNRFAHDLDADFSGTNSVRDHCRNMTRIDIVFGPAKLLSISPDRTGVFTTLDDGTNEGDEFALRLGGIELLTPRGRYCACAQLFAVALKQEFIKFSVFQD